MQSTLFNTLTEQFAGLAAKLGPAQLGVELDFSFGAGLTASCGQRVGFERHGLFAVADQHAPAAPSERHMCLPRAPVSRGP